MVAGTAGRVPDVIENTRNTMKAVQQNKLTQPCRLLREGG